MRSSRASSSKTTLWAAADILRGSIDSSDYKNFIFGLLFLKRLSDRFDEEREQLVRELAAVRVRFGYRRLTVLSKREGWCVAHAGNQA